GFCGQVHPRDTDWPVLDVGAPEMAPQSVVPGLDAGARGRRSFVWAGDRFAGLRLAVPLDDADRAPVEQEQVAPIRRDAAVPDVGARRGIAGLAEHLGLAVVDDQPGIGLTQDV